MMVGIAYIMGGKRMHGVSLVGGGGGEGAGLTVKAKGPDIESMRKLAEGV